MATRPVLSSYEKKLLRRREQEERKLSFNQGSRIPDRRDPVEFNLDDERLDDLNFVEQGCVTEPFDLELSADPDLEDTLDDLDDAEYDEDDRPVDRYEEMAERYRIDDDVADDQMLCDAIATSSWEEIANESRAIEVQVFKNLTNEDIVVEKSFIKMMNEQQLRPMLFGDSYECSLRRGAKSWKHTTTQAAQYLRHTWRGVHQIDTIRGAVPVNVVDDIDLVPFVADEPLWDTPELDDDSYRYKLLAPDYSDDIIDFGPFIKDTGSPAHY